MAHGRIDSGLCAVKGGGPMVKAVVMSRFTSACNMLGGCGRRFHSTVQNNEEWARYCDANTRPQGMSLDEWGALNIEACPECLGADDMVAQYVTGNRFCEHCGQPRANGERTEVGVFETMRGTRVEGCKHSIAGGVMNGYVVPRAAFITH